MQRTAISSFRPTRLARLLLSAGALLAAISTSALAAPDGAFPPALAYQPTFGTTINFVGVTTPGSSGSAQINITPSGGSGSGSAATLNLGCTVVGSDAADVLAKALAARAAIGIRDE